MKYAGDILYRELTEMVNRDITNTEFFFVNNERVLRLAKTVLMLIELNKKLTEQRNRYTSQGIINNALNLELDKIVQEWDEE